MYPFCSIVQENVISDRADDQFSLKVLTLIGMSSVTMEFEKVLFHSECLLELLHQEGRVMKQNTRRVMKHNPILQGAMLSTHGTKTGMGNREDFLFSSVSIFHPLFFLASRHPSSFYCVPPPFVNLRMKFLLRGRVVTPRITKYLITSLRLLIKQ
jgi:hypothetical protein